MLVALSMDRSEKKRNKSTEESNTACLFHLINSHHSDWVPRYLSVVTSTGAFMAVAGVGIVGCCLRVGKINLPNCIDAKLIIQINDSIGSVPHEIDVNGSALGGMDGSSIIGFRFSQT